MDPTSTTPTPRIVRANRGGTLFVCGKCLKRHPDAKALKRGLKDGIKDRRDAFASTGRPARKARLVRTACLGLCPRRAVVLASAATLAGNEYVIVKDPIAMPLALARLLPPPSPAV